MKMLDKNTKTEFNRMGWNLSLKGNIVTLTNKIINSSEIQFWEKGKYYCIYKIFNESKVIEEAKSGFKKYPSALRYLKRMAFGHVYQLMKNE